MDSEIASKSLPANILQNQPTYQRYQDINWVDAAQKWTGADLLKMIDILGLSDLGPFLREQEFLPDDPNEESPFGSLDAAELEEVFEDSGVPRIQIDALKVALRYLKGEFTNVSVKA